MDKVKGTVLRIARKIYFKLKRCRDNMLFETTPLGLRGYRCQIKQPSLIVHPENVYMHDFSLLSEDAVILSNKGKFVLGKYSRVAVGLRAVPDIHTSTVGIPHCCLGPSHIHDKVEDVVVDEDVWIGLNVTLLGGVHIHRGCVIGANTLLNKHSVVPPYSVVAGNPARIIAVKFNAEQILQHEKKLYLPEERFTREQIEELFSKYYEGKRVFGVDANLSDEEKETLQATMQKIGFSYPEP